MKVLVTGGAGFIASQIADAYIGAGHSVVIVDDLSSGRKEFINPKAVFYEADVRNQAKMEEIFAHEKPEVLNHHAAQISVRHSVEDPGKDADINIRGFINLLEAGRKNGLKKCVFASSGGVVYGDADVYPTPETYTPLQPLSPYGISKLSSELFLYVYHRTYGIPYVALRYANIYGPRQNPHGEAGVVAIFSQKLLAGEVPTINGDGKQKRDYVFVGDVVLANMKALDTSFIGACNIGTGKETDVIELFNAINGIIKSAVTPAYGPAKVGEQKRSCLDNTLAGKVLGWKPSVDLSGGLAKTVAYFKQS